MPNGRQLKQKYYQDFLDWMGQKTDEDFRLLVCRGVLHRGDIAKEIGFCKSVLAQNPEVREELRALEERLRDREVLPPKVPPELVNEEIAPVASEETGQRRALDQNRMRRLEQDVAALRAERDLWRGRAERYEALDRILMSSGRVPR